MGSSQIAAEKAPGSAGRQPTRERRLRIWQANGALFRGLSEMKIDTIYATLRPNFEREVPCFCADFA